ncbi:RNA polymerase sigma factor [Nocardioides coralli]|uniref:RNA polymerase sigma factor n=1 Tax=Nocardioides coralli TaxID=2872154 RepID=UPI001CA3C005|nr:sigma-70 family RNA polymerase sigma factor [Nocardioides coralli]QZY28305.1 sigma-70 family RNA polymerase sigma factor [Nocardioides coralli]
MRGEADYDWYFRATFPRLQRTVFLIVRDWARAEELTQDAFLQMARKWRTVSQYERPDAWVRRVAIRLAVQDARRESRRREKESRSVHGIDAVLPDPDVARAVASLAPRQRAAVVLYYWDDRPVQEIALILQVSESTVKQHLHRARIRLAELLGEAVEPDVR